MLQTPLSSIETKSSWAVATMALVTMLMAFGASPAFTAGIGANIFNLLVIRALVGRQRLQLAY